MSLYPEPIPAISPLVDRAIEAGQWSKQDSIEVDRAIERCDAYITLEFPYSRKQPNYDAIEWEVAA